MYLLNKIIYKQSDFPLHYSTFVGSLILTKIWQVGWPREQPTLQSEVSVTFRKGPLGKLPKLY